MLLLTGLNWGGTANFYVLGNHPLQDTGNFFLLGLQDSGPIVEPPRSFSRMYLALFKVLLTNALAYWLKLGGGTANFYILGNHPLQDTGNFFCQVGSYWDNRTQAH